MNSRTARLIRRFCTATGRNYRVMKKAWLKLNPVQKHQRRQMMQQEVE